MDFPAIPKMRYKKGGADVKKVAVLLLIASLMLSGCSYWMNGSYSSIKPHEGPFDQEDKPAIPISNYTELTEALISLVESGAEDGSLSLQYDTEEIARADMNKAIQEVRTNNPFAAYAVEDIRYALGASGSRNAVRLQITYQQSRVRPDKIQRVETIDQVRQIVSQHLIACDRSAVLYFNNPEQVDYTQMVEDYALMNAQQIMETPTVTVNRYPEQGQQQMVELVFTYQTSRAELRTMQNKVAPVFLSAYQHTAGEWTATEKAQRLYSFLMERYEYTIETSITPAYSLLLFGEGDCKAFAMVYAAMCNQAKMDCRVVTGTRDGEPWVWNAIKIEGEYRYLDLLHCNSAESFVLLSREEMTGYVWDESLYHPVQENS
jgi:hypothetical protein